MPSYYDAAYAHLLRNGVCYRFLGAGGGDPGSPEAEAFHEILRGRAEADGLRVDTFWRQLSPGSAFLEPGVMLLRPNGDKYRWYLSDGSPISDEVHQTHLLPLLEEDWGEKLADARRRAQDSTASE